MDSKDMVYDETCYFRSSDFDYNNRLKPQSILELFENVAGRHANALHMGYEDLLEKGLAWVVIRTKFTILNQPKFEDKVVIKTWPKEKKKIEFDRDYLVLDQSGRVLIKGTSKWVLIDMVTRQLSRAITVFYPYQAITDSNYTSFTRLKKPSLNFELLGSYQVKRNDLDHNLHLNNTKYAEIVFNLVRENSKSNFKEIQFEYLHEARYNDIVQVFFMDVCDGTYYLIKTCEQDNALIFVAWEESNGTN